MKLFAAIILWTSASLVAGHLGLRVWDDPSLGALTRGVTATLSMDLLQPELAANFLENHRNLPPQLRAQFEATGLMHLLALSGAQIGASVALCAWLCGNGVQGFAISFGLGASSARRLARVAAAVAETATALALCATFGWGGSLVRAAAMRHLAYRLPRSWLTYLIPFQLPKYISSAGRIGAPLVGVSIVFGKAASAPGFLLSLLGSLTLSFCANSVARFRTHDGVAGILERALLTTAITSAITASLLSPLFPAHVPATVIANILAIPLVDLGIAPMSIAVVALPIQSSARDWAAWALDGACNLLAEIASTLTPTHARVSSARPWGMWQIFYIQCLVLVAWLLDAARRERARAIL